MGIYLDVAATAEQKYTDTIIMKAITEAMQKYWMNPSSLYATNVKNEINKCRTNIAKFIGAKSDEIYFTSGASESNNWAIRGWVDYQSSLIKNIITTPIEHASILKAVNNISLNTCTQYCEVDEFGQVDIQSLEKLLIRCNNESVLVSIGLANNEIGTLQKIRTISNLVHEYGGILHVDATQAFGHIPIDVYELDVDLMSASGHKISPIIKGIGFLYKRNSINIRPLIYGSQENELRGGTENVFGIIGLSKAVELCDVSENKIREMQSKRDYFIGCLEYKFGCKLNGHCSQRLPNNINVTFSQNITGESLLYMLDISGIKVSTGSACNSHSIELSSVLKSIGLSNENAIRTIRITLPNDITYSDIDRVVEEIEKAIKLIEE